MELTQDEIRLLRQAQSGPRIIAGSEPRESLKTLIDAGLIAEAAARESETEYKITETGRKMLSEHVSAESIPVEDLNASNDE